MHDDLDLSLDGELSDSAISALAALLIDAMERDSNEPNQEDAA